MNKWFSKAALFLIVLIAIAFSFKSLREPDLWWIFRVGEWIAANKWVPTEDVFSYTYAGVDWINVKWFFELVTYWIAKSIGPEFVYVLQAAVAVLIVYYLIQTGKYIGQLLNIENANVLQFGQVFLFILFFIGIEYRLNGRPEMTSLLLTVIYLYHFMKFRVQNGNSIFWLIPLQVLWVNSHEAFGIGIVIIGIFLAGAWMEWLAQKQKTTFPKKLTLAGVLAILATAINPHGPYMIIHPYIIFTQVGSNHYTTELNSAFYRPDDYFGFKEPWIAIALFGIALISIAFLVFKRKEKPLAGLINTTGFGYILALIAFFYLGLTGHRNVPFGILLAMMVLLPLTAHWSKTLQKLRVPFQALSIVLLLSLYLSVVSNTYYEKLNPKDEFGLKTYAAKNPTTAAQFVKDHKLKGTCFSDYLTSAYFLWELGPDFKSFIDLRDLDVFPMDFFYAFTKITFDPIAFEQANETYKFNYVLLYRPSFEPLHQHLYQSDEWVLVNIDPVCAIYLKNTTEHAELIANYGVQKQGITVFKTSFQPKPATFSTGLSTLLNPWYQVQDKEEVNTTYLAAEYFSQVGDFTLASAALNTLLQANPEHAKGLLLSGNMHTIQGDQMPSDSLKDAYYKYATQQLLTYNKLEPKSAKGFLTLASLSMRYNNVNQALNYLNKGKENNPKNADIRVAMAEAYQGLMAQDPKNKTRYIQLWFEHMMAAHKYDPGNQMTIMKLALAHCQRNECEQAAPFLRLFEGRPGMATEDRENVEKCKKKCLP